MPVPNHLNLEKHLLPIDNYLANLLDEVSHAEHHSGDSLPPVFFTPPTELQVRQTIESFRLIPEVNNDGESQAEVMKSLVAAVLSTWRAAPSTFMHPYRAEMKHCFIATTEKQGRGLYARDNIEPATAVLNEAPLLLLPQTSFENAARFIFLYPKNVIWRMLHLSAYTPAPALQNSPAHLLHHHLTGIVRSNAFGFLPGILSIQQFGDLVNHAVWPKKANVWYDVVEEDGHFKLEFATTRSVARNEELIFDYSEITLSKARRHEEAVINFGKRWEQEKRLRDQYGINRTGFGGALDRIHARRAM